MGESPRSSRISSSRPRGVRNAPRLLTNSRAHYPSSFLPVEDPINGSHGDLNINRPNARASSLPPPANPHIIPATSTGANILSGAQDFVINGMAISFQGDSNYDTIVVRGMKALSEHVIKGAEYDSSLRDPPPQCHPGTRVQLMEKILAWFNNAGREKALLWLSGPAGVGKSAVIQTFAESLAESNSVGATLFFSRFNNRNDPQRVFITIAFQLATRIPAYQIYITGRIALDPSLLEKGMKEQFRIFITEPFGNKGIGKGEGPWAVMLDGLDECEGVEGQSRIISLVSEFILKFPNAPLIWVIASRPEPHIVAVFDDEAVAPSHWPEYVPIDSTEACRDVEQYLDDCFKSMRKPFPHLPPNWPSESQLLKLSKGARGLFAFAKTAARFTEDPDFADPVSRLNLILSIIDRRDIGLIDDHPLALLDALYTQIVTSIPASVWRTTKQLLGFFICVQRRGDSLSLKGRHAASYKLNPWTLNLLGASIIFGFELSAAYASLHKLYSVLDIPDSKKAHKSRVTFLHASFGDYLTDRMRSKDFYIDRGELVDDVVYGLLQLYLDKSRMTHWEQYTSQLSTIPGPMFWEDLKKDAESSLEDILRGNLSQSKRGRGPLKSQQDRSCYLDALSRIDLVQVYRYRFHGGGATLMIELWNTFREELEDTGLFKEVPLRDLKVNHLSYETNKPAFAHRNTYTIGIRTLDRFKLMKYQLHQNLRRHPTRPAMICGSGPEDRIAFFAGTYNDKEGYFCFPYPY